MSVCVCLCVSMCVCACACAHMFCDCECTCVCACCLMYYMPFVSRKHESLSYYGFLYVCLIGCILWCKKVYIPFHVSLLG